MHRISVVAAHVLHAVRPLRDGLYRRGMVQLTAQQQLAVRLHVGAGLYRGIDADAAAPLLGDRRSVVRSHQAEVARQLHDSISGQGLILGLRRQPVMKHGGRIITDAQPRR